MSTYSDGKATAWVDEATQVMRLNPRTYLMTLIRAQLGADETSADELINLAIEIVCDCGSVEAAIEAIQSGEARIGLLTVN